MRKINCKKSSSDKRGQGLSISTLIIIILAIVVLVVLVFGFTTGWSNLWDRIVPYSGSNVASVIQACEVACYTNSQYDYCTRNRTLIADEKIFPKTLEEGEEKKNTAQMTCDGLAGDGRFGLECPGIDCPPKTEEPETS